MKVLIYERLGNDGTYKHLAKLSWLEQKANPCKSSLCLLAWNDPGV
jgi:hypothetical protein